MTDAQNNIIRERIDTGPVTPVMVLVVAIGFLLNVVDGFDVVAMSVSASSLSNEWGISRAQLGPIFSATLVGMAIGAAVLAPYADKFGRRMMILFASALVGVSMIMTGFIPKSILLLIVIRFISGIGIGIIIVSSVAIASEFVPGRFRNLAVNLAIVGYPFGAMIVGPAANVIIPAQGWEMVFIYGGIATLAMGVLIYFIMPESVEFLGAKKNRSAADLSHINRILARLKRAPIESLPPHQADNLKAANVASLMTPALRTDTLYLWTIYFMGFLTVYFLLSWIPTVFEDSGYTRAEGIGALTFLNIGAIFGALIIGLIATKIKLAKPTALFFLGAAAMLAAIAILRPQSLFILNAMIFVIGLFMLGGFGAVYALAARVYPPSVRATGIGWSAGLGRVGAILSPIVAGLLVSNGWGMYGLFLLFAAPAVIAAALTARFKV